MGTLLMTGSPALTIAPAQRQFLKGLAHSLKPIVAIGQRGLNDAVLAELDRTLEDHELVKLKLAGNHETRTEQAVTAASACQAELVQQLGGIAVLYRANTKSPRIVLPRPR